MDVLDPKRALNISMFAPWHDRCGIRDYTAHLVHSMDALPEIGLVRIVAAPSDAARPGIAGVMANWARDAQQFARLGDDMNAAADIAHVQHQYFLFGGVAPHRSHITSFWKKIRVPVVVTVHEIAEAGEGILSRMAVSAANKMNFAHSAIEALVVHTETDRRSLQAMGLPDRRIHVIRHPVPPALPMPAQGAARRTLEATFPELAGRRIATLFGFLANKKGHRVALQALSRLPPDIALVFAGGQHPDDHTDYVPSLRAAIEQLGLGDRVVVTGYLREEQVPEIMAATDIALAPFLRTSGSGSLANLLAYGRAIIASDIAPHRGLLAAEPDLLTLFPTENPASLAATVEALLNDTAHRESLQQAALAYAARNAYTELASRTLAVYREILRG